jgi:4'-phosphopantetheinyl transferase
VIWRWYLRLLLGRILRLPANSLRFEYGDFGKPRLTSPKDSDSNLAISSSGDLIFKAIASGRAVGVDVEMVRADIDVDRIV